jgi:hypothetical protein
MAIVKIYFFWDVTLCILAWNILNISLFAAVTAPPLSVQCLNGPPQLHFT